MKNSSKKHFIHRTIVVLLMIVTMFTLQSVSAAYTHVALAQDSSTPAPPATQQESGDVDTGSADELDEWLNMVIDTLSILIGLAIAISIIFAGIQYITARDNASQVSAAKNRILMTTLAFFMFLMGYATLQWLIPGGIW